MPGPTFLEGETVTLTPVEEEDLEFLQRNINDPAVWRTLSANRPYNMAQERDWFERLNENDDLVSLLVCADGEPVGSVGLHGVDDTDGTAELGYWVDPGEQRQGYAREAAELVITYGFDQLRLHKVTARAFEHNDASRGLLESLGFTEEGVHRAEAFVDGVHRDVHYYGLLAEEWA